jgi:transcriptional regulator NrdR family protein
MQRCPYCKKALFRVVTTRTFGDDFTEIFRERKCRNCGRNRKSWEITEELYRELREAHKQILQLRATLKSKS